MCISLVHVDQNLNICPIKIVDSAGFWSQCHRALKRGKCPKIFLGCGVQTASRRFGQERGEQLGSNSIVIIYYYYYFFFFVDC
jgi:hypothetical protein